MQLGRKEYDYKSVNPLYAPDEKLRYFDTSKEGTRPWLFYLYAGVFFGQFYFDRLLDSRATQVVHTLFGHDSQL